MTDPHGFAWAETLRNGLAVTLRELRADDREKIAKAIRQLDRESIYTRLFSYRTELADAGSTASWGSSRRAMSPWSSRSGPGRTRS